MVSDSTKGVGGILAAATFFTFMAVGTKFAARAGVPHGEITFIRFASGFFVLAALGAAGVIRLEMKNRKWLVIRGLTGGAAISCYFFALSKGALATSVLLNASYPIFVALFSSFVIGEKVRKFVYPILAVALLGIVFIIKPVPGHIRVSDLFALASAILAALGILSLRKLRETDNVWTILTALNFVGMIMATGFFLSDPVMPGRDGLIAVAVVALASNLAQVSLTFAYKYIRASEGSILIKSQVVFSALIGYYVFGEMIDPFFMIGAVLVIGSSAVLTIMIRRADKKTA